MSSSTFFRNGSCPMLWKNRRQKSYQSTVCRRHRCRSCKRSRTRSPSWKYRVDKTRTRFKMELSAEKTKLVTNSANGIQREITVKGQKLGILTSLKYLGDFVSEDGSKPEILSRIEQTTGVLTKLKPIWRDNDISLGSKVKLMRSLVISIFLYAYLLKDCASHCNSYKAEVNLERNNISFGSNVKLMRSLVISIFLFACERWTLKAE